MHRRQLQIGLTGAAVAALCCFTPVLVIALAAFGLAGWVAYLDAVLWPLFGAFAFVAVLALLRGRRARRDPRPASSADEAGPPEALTLVTFAGCPHAAQAREILQRAGRPFREVLQDDLPEGHPQRNYSSPSILLGETLLHGASTGAAGCSIEPPDAEQLLATLRA